MKFRYYGMRDIGMTDSTRGFSGVEKLLALWIVLCIVLGLTIRKNFLEFSQHLAIRYPGWIIFSGRNGVNHAQSIPS